jgi:hypothetical protein
LNFNPAAFTNAMFAATSRLMSASNSSGVIGIGSMPCGWKRACTSGSASAFCVSVRSRSMIGRGVLAGTNYPIQKM